MKKPNITFVLFARNEARRIEFAIKNFVKFGPVIILDGGSTDETKQISESLGAKFFLRPLSEKANVETQENLNFIKEIIDTGWIYWGYVDNLAPLKLIEKMIEISAQDQYKKVNLPMYTYLWGNTEHFAHKSYAPFLFHKDFIDFTDNYIHGLGKFLGNPNQELFLPNELDYAIRHFSTYNGNKFIHGHLRYAEQEAFEKHTRGDKFSALKLLAAIVRYIWIYGRYSYKLGRLGLIIVLNYATFRIMAYTKLYELENKITIEGIESAYSEKKKEFLKQFNF